MFPYSSLLICLTPRLTLGLPKCHPREWPRPFKHSCALASAHVFLLLTGFPADNTAVNTLFSLIADFTAGCLSYSNILQHLWVGISRFIWVSSQNMADAAELNGEKQWDGTRARDLCPDSTHNTGAHKPSSSSPLWAPGGAGEAGDSSWGWSATCASSITLQNCYNCATFLFLFSHMNHELSNYLWIAKGGCEP